MDNTHKMAEARAVLASVRASLCPHGVRWSNCKQHDTEPETDDTTGGDDA